tara:strand:- start:21946 stop:22851 length:906 start_codon:yes stop_codon:yes gene_type:complete
MENTIKHDGELKAERWEVDNEEYHASKEEASSSTLKLARRSLELYEAMYVKGEVTSSGPSPEMKFGSAFHCALLEPEEFEGRYTFEPEEIDGEPINKRLKAHREFLAGWGENNGGKVVLAANDAERIEKMMAMINENSAVKTLMATGEAELAVKFSINQKEAMTGDFPLKAMFDWVCSDREIIMDVKTTRLAGGPEVFRREIDNREYHCQAALYCEAYRQMYGVVPEFYWLFVHTEAPYENYVFKMGDATREIGTEIQLATIRSLSAAQAMNHYRNPTVGTAETTIEVPDWTLRRHGKSAE